MSRIPGLLAQAEVDEVVTGWRAMTGATREAIIVCGALTVVTLLVLVWAIFIRKRRRRHHSHHHWHHPHRGADESAETEPAQTTAADPALAPKRRKWRHRRREHRGRNPTLAETGGLPPIRKEEGSGPAP